jgi:putative phosphotransacetylase
MKTEVPINLSNRHIHLSEKDLEKLFGKGYNLTSIKDLSQPGQFACDECVDIEGPKGTMKNIRILGPTRPDTQIELLLADTYKLGIPPIIKESGDIAGSPGLKITGPKGSIDVKEGAIVAARHIHMSNQDALEYGLKDKDVVSVEVPGMRGIVFNNVLVRVGDKYSLDMHIDTEEGNAAGIKNGTLGKIIR